MSPPPLGEILVNVDAALFADRRHMAIRVVFRDHSGECLFFDKFNSRERLILLSINQKGR